MVMITVDSKQLFEDSNDVRKYMRVELPAKMEELLVDSYGHKAVADVLKYARVMVDYTLMPDVVDLIVLPGAPHVKQAIHNLDKINTHYHGANPND